MANQITPVGRDYNLYPGVNPHLNSELQEKTPHVAIEDTFDNKPTWEDFHDAYIYELKTDLRRQLRGTGYQIGYDRSIVVPEQRPDGTKTKTPRQPDVFIVGEPNPAQMQQGNESVETNIYEPSFTIPLRKDLLKKDTSINPEQIAEEEHEGAFPIVDASDPNGVRVVAWVEVLSDMNLNRKSADYQKKREGIIRSGVTLIEIDLLDRHKPVIKDIPDYTKKQEDSQPYYIASSDQSRGTCDVYQFGVLEPIPNIPVVLGGARTELDFQRAYNQTFERQGYGQRINYVNHPNGMDSYTEDDQDRIAAQNATITERHIRGELDLVRDPAAGQGAAVAADPRYLYRGFFNDLQRIQSYDIDETNEIE